MQFKRCNKLDKTIVDDPDFFGRKRPDLITFFYDVTENNFVPIPVELEHAQLAYLMLGLTETQIKENPMAASHLIPIVYTISTSENKVIGLLVGVSSLEMGLGVHYHKADLEKAFTEAMIFVTNGEFSWNVKKPTLIIKKFNTIF